MTPILVKLQYKFRYCLLLLTLLVTTGIVYGQGSGAAIKAGKPVAPDQVTGKTYRAYYSPFQDMPGFPMTEASIQDRKTGGVQFPLSKQEYKQIVRQIHLGKKSDKRPVQSLGVLVKDSEGSVVLVMDSYGYVRLNGEEFSIEPYNYLQVYLRLEAKADSILKDPKGNYLYNSHLVPDSRTAYRIAHAIWVGKYKEHEVSRFRISTPVREGKKWVVRASQLPNQRKKSKGELYILEIDSSNGRIITDGFWKPDWGDKPSWK